MPGVSVPEGASPVAGVLARPSLMDYPERMCLLVFTSGCNMRCGYCHNAELIERREGMSWAKLAGHAEEARADWIDAVCVSGGEPTTHPDLETLLRFFKERGFRVKLDTNGSRPAVLERVLSLVDFVAMDIKTSPESYGGLTGFGQADAVRASLTLLQDRGVPHQLRCTHLPGHHTPERLHALGSWIQGAASITLQPFLPRLDLQDTDFRAARRSTPEDLLAARGILAAYLPVSA